MIGVLRHINFLENERKSENDDGLQGYIDLLNGIEEANKEENKDRFENKD